jgi:hypothetical protein
MESPIEVVRRFCAAWSDDIEAVELAAFFTDDAVYHNIPLTPVTGREDIANTISSFIRPGPPGIEGIEFRSLRSWNRQGRPRSSWGTRLCCAGRKPLVEVVEDRLDGRPELVGDLVLALALCRAPPGLADDDLEHAGERDALQPGHLGRDCSRLADRGGDGSGLTV